MTAPDLSEPVIADAQIVAGHDGAAEMVVRLRHPNGCVRSVVLDAASGFKLMNDCDASDVQALAGHSWRKLLTEP